MSKIKKDFKKDKRHVICTLITLISVFCGFLFPNAVPRLIKSLLDLITSIAFYMFQIASPEANPIPATINELPSWQIFPELWQRVTFLPETWEEFSLFWSTYLSLLFNKYNFLDYWYNIIDFIYYGSRIMLILLPLAAALLLSIIRSKNKVCTVRGKKSPALVRFEKFVFREVYPRRIYLKSFLDFLDDHPEYKRTWCVIWALYFNLFSIGFSLVGYYLYFVSSWDLLSIYTQLLKLQRDISPMIRFIPDLGWLIIFTKLYNWFCRWLGFAALDAGEKANCAVMRLIPIICAIGGIPGAGKTVLATSMAQTSQKMMYEDAFQIMMTREAQFPNFPWQVFRDVIQYQVDQRKICDILGAKKWVSDRRRYYDGIIRNYNPIEWQRLRRRKKLYDYTFGYDYVHYRSKFTDELKVIHLYDALESYAAAYLIFAVQSNIIFSNYSIREDSQLLSKGNLPLRDNDFFDRDPEFQNLYSRYSHIEDFNTLRLGKKFQQNIDHSNGAPVGVIVITEIDKEFKNMQLLKEVKANDEEVNQKNDLHDAALMMIRHGSIIDYKPFVRVIADLQRPEAWGAGGRELGDVVLIADKTKMLPVLPFFSPYWLTEGIFSAVYNAWLTFYSEYRHRRSDDTLPIYLINNLMNAINEHYVKIQGMFGMQVLTLEIQSGKLDGEPVKDYWRLFAKKDHSNRAMTDCLQSVWIKSKTNTMHIDDFLRYAGILATREECDLQNSFFQNDVHKIKENN